VTAGAPNNRAALAAGQKYLDVRSGVRAVQLDGKPERLSREALPYIITQLEDAVQADPLNARYWADLANWYGTLYETVVPTSEEYEKYRARGFRYAQVAQERDPLGVEGYLAETRLHLFAAGRAPTLALRSQAARLAPQPLLKIIEHWPNDAQLHYRLAVAYFAAEEPGLGKRHADRALALDLPDLAPERRLTDAQRRQAEHFTTRPPPRRPLP
jgi:hypothetical protein